MLEETVDLLPGFIDKMSRFLERATPEAVANMFPGYVVSPGECFFPTHIPVKGPLKRFRVTAGLDKPTSLCFSKIIFAGTIDDDDVLVDVSRLGEFEMSSRHKMSSSAAAAVEGGIFSNNVHSEKEVTPWWQAIFPDNVRVRGIFYYRRSDWTIIHEQHIRISGFSRSGDETVLYYPESPDYLENQELVRAPTKAALKLAVEALETGREALSGNTLEQYEALVSEGLTDVGGWLDDYEGKGKLPSLSGKDRAGPANKLLEALTLSIGGVKDFGITEEDALEIDLSGIDAQHIRIRAYGETPVGLGGLEVYSGENGQLIKRFDKSDVKFRYSFSALTYPESFSADLYTNIQSRRIDMGEVSSLGKLRVWNINRQHAANTLFLEITVRANDDQPWQVVYDHGKVYRQTRNVLKLINYLIRADWSPAYAHFISKLFSMYRRKRLMTPLARLVRHREHLNAAVFKGSDEIWPKTKYAAPLRLGKHGLRVPIGYRDEKVIMGQLLEMRDKVRSLGHMPLFMYGTLLGAIREKDFIPHDDDVDLAVILSGVGPDTVNEECDKFIELLNENGVKANRGARHSPLIHCHRGPVTYDIFILGHVGDTVYWPHTALKVVPERADIFLPIGEVEFKGEVFDAPADPEAVCKARYGDDWHIPNPAFEW